MRLNQSIYNADWDEKALSDLGTFSRGKSRHRPRNDPDLYVDGRYPLIQTGEIRAASLRISDHAAAYNEVGLAQSKLWPEGTLCITIAANIAETALLGYPMCFPDSVVGFTADNSKSSEVFMHYVFTYIRNAIQRSVTGSIQDNINIEYLTNLNLNIPQKVYQDKIVSVLASLDEKTELNQRINAELEALAKTIYDYWFVQFDFPDANGRPYKSSGGAMEWSDALNKEIPAGWKVAALSEMVTVSTATTNPADQPEQGFKHISIPSFDENGSYRFEHGREIRSNKFNVKKNDLLVSKLNPWSNRVVADTDHENLICSTEFLVWQCGDQTMQAFLQMIATHPHFVAYCTQSAAGTSNSHRRVNPTVMMQYRFPYSDAMLEAFGNIAAPMLQKQVVSCRENRSLVELRDWLLPMLMNGQVRVR